MSAPGSGPRIGVLALQGDVHRLARLVGLREPPREVIAGEQRFHRRLLDQARSR